MVCLRCFFNIAAYFVQYQSNNAYTLCIVDIQTMFHQADVRNVYFASKAKQNKTPGSL
jgi:hypothetical protein